MQSAVQQIGLFPVHTERRSPKTGLRIVQRPQTRQIYVQRYFRERAARSRDTAHFPEASHRTQQVPTQYRLFFRTIMPQHLDKV